MNFNPRLPGKMGLILFGTAFCHIQFAHANIPDAADAGGQLTEFSRMSLEELGNIVITSVSKKPERLDDAAASIFVITSDDIRRSGATSLPEALRLAPNLQVAQVSASGYAISARGFNGSSANKLLVLIDGRSVYSPLFSGVFWDVQDVMLDDIERIEVISGPGGTLWGVNAVNGVINVITRSSKETQGGLLSAGAGNQESNASARYGDALGADGTYRLYAKTRDFDHTMTAAGTPVNDGWHQSQAGFRADWKVAGDQIQLQGNTYRGTESQAAPGEISVTGMDIPLGPILVSGSNLSSQWTHLLDDGSNFKLQTHLDRTDRNVNPTFIDRQDMVDLQMEHTLRPFGDHTLIWGAEYRYGKDQLTNSKFVAFLPANVNQTWTSVYLQDEVTLLKDVQLTVGAREERNDYTGNEFLPNMRLGWKLTPDDFIWMALSRTVRAPSRLDVDAFVPGTAPYLLAGGPKVISEVARVAEIGYHGQPFTNLSYSVTLFHADYDHLRTEELAPSDTYVLFASGAKGHTNGVEMWGKYQVAPWWRLSAGLSSLRNRIRLYHDDNEQGEVIFPGQDPAVGWSLQSSFDMPAQTELDLFARHVSGLSDPLVPQYTAVGLRVGWNASKNVEISITGQNLIGNGHGEFSDIATRTDFGRTGFVKVVARF